MQSDRKHNPALTPQARELRKNMTKQERRLWHDFLRRYPIKTLRQKVIGVYIVDFYCAKAKLVIELDGSQHLTEEGKVYDVARDQFMQGIGIKTIRYTNAEVDKQFEAVCVSIDAHIKARMK
jgi:very-short-patch-repair endonuclease